MPDYNIYIHANGTGGSGIASQTTPWRDGQPSGSGETATTPWGKREAEQVIRGIEHPSGLVSSAVSTGLRMIPKVAVAYSVVKTADSLLSFALQYNSLETGDYRAQYFVEGIKNAIHTALNPISMIANAIRENQAFRLANYKQAAARELLGDSVINSYSNRGV